MTGQAWCWGHNNEGDLGDGDVTGLNKFLPVRVEINAEFDRLSASWHTCGLLTDGRAYCWGPDFHGGLGDGIRTYFGHGVVAVEGDLTFLDVATGASEFSCGIVVGGAAHCWGRGDRGQLGNLSTTSESVPVPVSGGRSYTAVAAGPLYVCAIEVGGALYCWGDNVGGQLGNGSTSSSLEPAPVSGGLTFASVSAGGIHACGITADGSMYCWGNNQYGQLGDGSTTPSTTPREVLAGYSMVEVSAGLGHTCGISADGSAHCWGRNDSGQLGDGSFSDSVVPVQVR
jgi:alpha-tubulin suppressor-like RCC1 family protein